MTMSYVERSAARLLDTGALCAEAQADGVPCTEIGRACDICERALDQWRRDGGVADPALRDDGTPDA